MEKMTKIVFFFETLTLFKILLHFNMSLKKNSDNPVFHENKHVSTVKFDFTKDSIQKSTPDVNLQISDSTTTNTPTSTK